MSLPVLSTVQERERGRERETDGQTDRDRETDRETDRQAGRQSIKQTLTYQLVSFHNYTSYSVQLDSWNSATSQIARAGSL